ncbi:MAG: T9SS type A sorting domain-containing protein [Saprospirales bacterium]|nr:T9SS type A sorting domain-containing protein [Saprospirales bacterium]MBK8493077.1 T9SS type A sorting domain-containing protein [Saprospirales bacterium]
MKKTLLIFFFFLPIGLVINAANDPWGHPGTDDVRPVVYPNPANDYIGLSNDESVQQLVIYNFSGRQVCAFNASKGQKYNISELPTGMYLVQFLDVQNRIMHTQRLQKR